VQPRDLVPSSFPGSFFLAAKCDEICCEGQTRGEEGGRGSVWCRRSDGAMKYEVCAHTSCMYTAKYEVHY